MLYCVNTSTLQLNISAQVLLQLTQVTFDGDTTWLAHDNIVAFQRGGVSKKPTLGSGQRQDTGPGILLTYLAITTYSQIF